LGIWERVCDKRRTAMFSAAVVAPFSPLPARQSHAARPSPNPTAASSAGPPRRRRRALTLLALALAPADDVDGVVQPRGARVAPWWAGRGAEAGVCACARVYGGGRKGLVGTPALLWARPPAASHAPWAGPGARHRRHSPPGRGPSARARIVQARGASIGPASSRPRAGGGPAPGALNPKP
jgi:hypothetical protein